VQQTAGGLRTKVCRYYELENRKIGHGEWYDGEVVDVTTNSNGEVLQRTVRFTDGQEEVISDEMEMRICMLAYQLKHKVHKNLIYERPLKKMSAGTRVSWYFSDGWYNGEVTRPRRKGKKDKQATTMIEFTDGEKYPMQSEQLEIASIAYRLRNGCK
jgi:hypothetical protein